MSIQIFKNKEEYIKEYHHILPPHFQSMPPMMVSMMAETFIRQYLVEKGMFALVTEDFADALAQYLQGKKVLEVMAGAGYLAKALHKRGIDIRATDDYSWKLEQHSTFQVEKLSVEESIATYQDVDFIIASWIPMGDAATKFIEAIKQHNPNTPLIIIGEWAGGCTANDEFFDEIQIIEDERFFPVQDTFEHWDALHDHVELVQIVR